MRSKKVWRYWCDFCSKGSCQKSSMVSHERGCTANPNRVCGLCAAAELEQKPIAELISAYRIDAGTDEQRRGEYDCTVDPVELLKARNRCPACALAASRQSGIDGAWCNLNYKEAHAAFWAGVNADKNCQFS